MFELCSLNNVQTFYFLEKAVGVYFDDCIQCVKMASRSNKRKCLTLEERVGVIRQLDQGVSCRAVALSLNCGKTQVTKIKAERQEILKKWEEGGRGDSKYYKRRHTEYEDQQVLHLPLSLYNTHSLTCQHTLHSHSTHVHVHVYNYDFVSVRTKPATSRKRPPAM